MVFAEHRTIIVWIDHSIVAISPFRVDGPLSSKRIRLSVQTPRAEMNDEVEQINSALKSGPVRFFCHIWGEPEPDRFSIKGNIQKTGPEPLKPLKTVQTGPGAVFDQIKNFILFSYFVPLIFFKKNKQID